MNLLDLLPKAYAHCDVPCGLYDPRAAQMAAATIIKMVEKLQALPQDNLSLEDQNSAARYILTKEEHGRIGKHELTVLWADFFKEEDLKDHPDLHDIFWKALKLFSYSKQHVDLEKANELKAAVINIAGIFEKVKASRHP